MGALQVVEVDDADDPRVADFRTLNDVELRLRYQDEHGIFIAEGPNVVRALLASSYEVRSLLLTPRQLDDLRPDLEQAGISAPVLVGPPALLDTIVGFHLHRGALAAGVRRPPAELDEVLEGARLVVVLERVNDHENLGALARSARALGVDALLLDPETCDPLYRRAIRVSMGHLLLLPWARLPSLPDGLKLLQQRGFRVLALTPDGSAEPLPTISPTGRDALVVGAEGPGLTEATMAAADLRVRIPMRAGVDSLNVATAAAIASAHLARLDEQGPP